MAHPVESDEWLDELIRRWNEMFKKSMTSLVLLRLIGDRDDVEVADLQTRLTATTGWTLTERGLYRALQRLAADGLLAVHPVPAPRTGAKRNTFRLTPLGMEFIAAIAHQHHALLAAIPDSPPDT